MAVYNCRHSKPFRFAVAVFTSALKFNGALLIIFNSGSDHYSPYLSSFDLNLDNQVLMLLRQVSLVLPVDCKPDEPNWLLNWVPPIGSPVNCTVPGCD